MANQLSESVFLRVNQIVGDAKRGIPPLIPIGRSTWWEWVSKGKAPKPIKLGPRTTVWRAEDIRQFIESTRQEVLQ